MSRTPATFKQADLERAVKAARACDLPIVRTEISKDGTIVLVHHKSMQVAESDLDKWEANRASKN